MAPTTRGRRAGRGRRKKLHLPYLPGSREGSQDQEAQDGRLRDRRISLGDKVEGKISTLLLGLYNDKGELDFVGHCSGFPAAVRRQLQELLPPLASRASSAKRIPGGQSRWSRGKELDWNPVRPELVCEVRFDKLEKNRFRHGTGFIRFRPTRTRTCTWREVRPPRRQGDPTVESLLKT